MQTCMIMSANVATVLLTSLNVTQGMPHDSVTALLLNEGQFM
jgi:hypothetical protein